MPDNKNAEDNKPPGNFFGRFLYAVNAGISVRVFEIKIYYFDGRFFSTVSKNKGIEIGFEI